ncbi:MAG: DUF1566 domain-containing protein [Planctomycetes bacterium]|nr:DUF1566 domain-containing protein [Planctomycetota bacterium]
MKKLLGLCVALCAGAALGRLFEGVPGTAAGGGVGGGVAECAAKNGDVNADGAVNLTDAVTILGHLFLGNPTELVGLCAGPELEACHAELATARAALARSQEEIVQLQAALADCRAGNPSGLPDTGQTKCWSLVENQGWVEVPCAEAACQGQNGAYATGCPREGRFTDNGDGTVTDHCTGLMWQKDTADVNGDGRVSPERDGGDRVPWCDALAYCEGLSFAGHDDWKLPDVRELQSIVDYGRHGPAIDPVFGAFSLVYWSSTSSAVGPDVAWHVYFHLGDVYSGDGKGSPYYVRAVRSGP